ncbi:Cytochrome P450 [Nymphaea thermarum]|nr:Cytochrome P450 [Nymphaea thermarum]
MNKRRSEGLIIHGSDVLPNGKKNSLRTRENSTMPTSLASPSSGNSSARRITDVIPWLEWLDVGVHLKAMKSVHKKMDQIASAWLSEHRREKESGSKEAEKDFIDVLRVDPLLSNRRVAEQQVAIRSRGTRTGISNS